jgi:hypothetical protein
VRVLVVLLQSGNYRFRNANFREFAEIKGEITMKVRLRVCAGLILGVILISFLVAPVCANDDSSWLSPDSLEDILAWMKTTTPQVPTVPTDSFGAFPDTTPSYSQPDDSSWFSPASQEQILAWGKMIARQNAATYPSTLSQADRIRLFKSYSNNGSTPAAPEITVTPVPTTQPVTLSVDRFSSQKPVTVPVLPTYIPTTRVTSVPTPAPATGSAIPGQKTGVSLTELNLQGKFVRITNNGITPVIMSGWKITNNRGNSLNFIDFPLGDGSTFTYILNPYSTLTVYFGKEGMVTSTELYYPPGSDFWNPAGDTASLYDSLGQLAGRVSV